MYRKSIQTIPVLRNSRIRPAAGGGATAPLDATLGFALLKDRRICIWQKTRALATGASIVAGLLLVTAVAARWTTAGGRPFNLEVDGIAVAAGTLLFGALVLKAMSPREVVSRLRCERFRVIPLRNRKVEAVVRIRTSSETDVLGALGYSYPSETKEYAVIPRRVR